MKKIEFTFTITWMISHFQTEVTTVVDIVDTEAQIANGSFHGLYNLALPGRCFADGNRLLLSTPQQTEVRSYVVHLGESFSITRDPVLLLALAVTLSLWDADVSKREM